MLTRENFACRGAFGAGDKNREIAGGLIEALAAAHGHAARGQSAFESRGGPCRGRGRSHGVGGIENDRDAGRGGSCRAVRNAKYRGGQRCVLEEFSALHFFHGRVVRSSCARRALVMR
jgi:hypothetical protein